MYIVYSKPNCTFCDQAKALLKSKGLNYKEIMFDVGQPKVEGAEYVNVMEFKSKYPNAKTAPQIFDDELYIGGFQELKKVLF